MRELTTGATFTIDTGTAPTGSMTVVPSGNGWVILTHTKSDHGDRVSAYATDGTHLVTVTGGDRVLPGGVNDTHVLIYGKTATYTAELNAGRLLRVSAETNYGTAVLSQSLVFWHEPTPDTSVSQVVATML
jgi:hypothetical protein